MNISQLEYFLAASRTLNFTRAATETFTSRQNLSHAVRDLEKELGTKLFAQEGNSLVLTVEGIEAAKRAQRIVDEVNELKRAFVPRETEPPNLNVLVGLNLISCTPYDISLAIEKAPGTIHLGEQGCRTCYEMIAEEQADVAIVGCMERDFPRCDSSLIAQSPLYLLVGSSSELAGKDSLDIVDLARFRVAILPDYEFQFAPFIEAYKARGLDVGAIDSISSVGLMLRAVRQGGSVGVASISFRENAPAGTKAIPLSDPKMKMNLYALYRTTSEKATAVSEFVAHVAHSLASGNDE